MSLIDYPGKICTVLFTRGCNFFCGFCHNPELVIPKQYTKRIPLYQIFYFIKKRKSKIDAITITGGEPTIYKDLPKFISKIKKLGYLVKLDTNGSNPKMLQQIIKLNLIDYIAMDVKNSPQEYCKTVQRKIDLKKIKQSIKIIKNSDIKYEFRTTVIPTLHDQKSIEGIGKLLKDSHILYLQQFRAGKHIDPRFSKLKSFTKKELVKFKKILQKYIDLVYIRGI